MHCHCGTNNRAPWWTFTDPCKPEVRPGTREKSASPAWLAAPAIIIIILFLISSHNVSYLLNDLNSQNIQKSQIANHNEQQIISLTMVATD